MVKNKHNLKVDKEEIIKQLCKAICPIIQPYTCQYLCKNVGNCQELREKVTKIYNIFCLGDADMKNINNRKEYDSFINKVNDTINTNKIDMKDVDLTKINSNLATSAIAQVDGITAWGPYIGKCPHCGSANIEANYGMVLTSMPPQYNCRCKDCKGTFFSGQIKQESQTVTPYNPDPGLPNYPDQPQKPQYDWGNIRQGWICPRCGKVNSPDRDFCDCSGNGGWGSPIIWCNSNGYVDYNNPTTNFKSSGNYVNPNPSTAISRSNTDKGEFSIE